MTAVGSAEWFLEQIREIGAGARWSVPRPTPWGLMHIHRPARDGREADVGVWRSTRYQLVHQDPGRLDLPVTDPVSILSGGGACAVLEREPGSERRALRWVCGPGHPPGDVLAQGISPTTRPLLTTQGQVLLCPEHPDGAVRSLATTVHEGRTRVVLVERTTRSTRITLVREPDERPGRPAPVVAEPAGSPLLDIPSSIPTHLVSSGPLLHVDDHLTTPAGDIIWRLPAGRVSAVVQEDHHRRPDGPPTASPGPLLAVTRQDGELQVRRLQPGDDPTPPLWRAPLGTDLRGMTVHDDRSLWLVTRRAEDPSRLERLDLTADIPPAPAQGSPGQCLHERRRTPGDEDTSVPYVVTASPCGSRRDDPPVLLTVYGGFGVEHWPEAEPTTAAWTRAGGLVVTAQVRGGGEHGPAWHAAGRGERKRRAVQDLLAIIRHVVADGLTRPGRIILCGASHGGLVALLAALDEDTRHPEVGGVAVTAPLLDVRDLSRHGNGRFWADEFPRSGAGRAAVSPLHVVASADTPLPPLWLASMGRDERVADDANDFARRWARRGHVTHIREADSAHVTPDLDQLDSRAAHMLSFAWNCTR
ncbi:prolyl oligopeptidase family serine peptidase [Arsenicicoccus dermatophilus]|uniref:prolyl oligopeptidase family serine peptidase n=1 Tax=Arsenicicoccus dermatophilus TaxID=1076331 RepID=UPI001F4CB212|nr:prolyl oligopeptidase family serine peptidase [Arsenicicoccus dermatophilus]MCH8611472.1 prolyl oligopeptidase family serine peptidase [Arsenicicoccus dermatophilus]